jgi:hypothetical protein
MHIVLAGLKKGTIKEQSRKMAFLYYWDNVEAQSRETVPLCIKKLINRCKAFSKYWNMSFKIAFSNACEFF